MFSLSEHLMDIVVLAAICSIAYSTWDEFFATRNKMTDEQVMDGYVKITNMSKQRAK